MANRTCRMPTRRKEGRKEGGKHRRRGAAAEDHLRVERVSSARVDLIVTAERGPSARPSAFRPSSQSSSSSSQASATQRQLSSPPPTSFNCYLPVHRRRRRRDEEELNNSTDGGDETMERTACRIKVRIRVPLDRNDRGFSTDI